MSFLGITSCLLLRAFKMKHFRRPNSRRDHPAGRHISPISVHPIAPGRPAAKVINAPECFVPRRPGSEDVTWRTRQSASPLRTVEEPASFLSAQSRFRLANQKAIQIILFRIGDACLYQSGWKTRNLFFFIVQAFEKVACCVDYFFERRLMAKFVLNHKPYRRPNPLFRSWQRR